MIQLLAPAGLAAAAALVVPLLIHLVRRSDRRVVSFAAMRYLPVRSHPRARLRVDRPLLLALRLGLLAGLAVLLALPAWRGHAAAAPPWVVVAPGVDALAARTAVRAPLAEWHRLSNSFPPLPDAGDAATALAADQVLAAQPVPINSLLRQLDRDLLPTVALTIVVPETLADLDAERLQLRNAASWVVLPGHSPAGAAVDTAGLMASGADTAGLMASGAEASGVAAGGQMSAPADASLRIAVRYDAAGASELPVVRALGAAWAADGRSIAWDIAASDVPLPPPPAWIFWLGAGVPETLRARARAGTRVLVTRLAASTGEVVLAGAQGAVLRAQVLGRGRLLSLTGPLRADALPALLAPDFPQRLWTALATPTRVPASAPAHSVAPLATPHTDFAPALSLGAPLALALALLFLGERLLATWARARRAA
jgi:hypothetical protein